MHCCTQGGREVQFSGIKLGKFNDKNDNNFFKNNFMNFFLFAKADRY